VRDDYTPGMRAEAIRVRDANAADVPALLGLVHAAFEQYRGRLDPPSGAHGETQASLRAALAAGGAVLASADDTPVGCVFYHRNGERVDLGRLSVLPALRRYGIGRRLTGEVEHRARALGAQRVELGVRIALPWLRAYYERCGYRVVREETHAGYSAPTYVVMAKDLR